MQSFFGVLGFMFAVMCFAVGARLLLTAAWEAICEQETRLRLITKKEIQ